MPGNEEVEDYLLATVGWEGKSNKIPRLRRGTKVTIMALTIQRCRERAKLENMTANFSRKGDVKRTTSMLRVNRLSSCWPCSVLGRRERVEAH